MRRIKRRPHEAPAAQFVMPHILLARQCVQKVHLRNGIEPSATADQLFRCWILSSAQ
jgi:hypothetical protein